MSRFPSRSGLRLAGGALLCLAIAAAYGQTSAPSALSLGEVIRLASERSPALAAQAYQERAAEALIEQAGLRPNPELDLSLENFMGTGAVQGVRSLEATVQASQTIERGGKRQRRIALAEREREVAAREYAVRRSEIVSAAASAFVEALAAQERMRLAAEPLRLARETAEAVDSRVKAGAASAAESARARAALAAAEADLARAEAAVSASRAALAAAWGGLAEEVTGVAGVIRLPEGGPTLDSILAGLGSHPRLALQKSVIEGRRAALELEQAQAAQDLTVGGGLRFLRDGTDAAFVAGVSVPLPVRNRNQGKIRAARESLTGAELGTRAVEAELRAVVTALWQELSASHRAARTLRQRAMPAVEEAYASVRSAYDQGQLPLIDVLDAQRALVAIRREILDAESAYALALVRIDALTDVAFANVNTLIGAP